MRLPEVAREHDEQAIVDATDAIYDLAARLLAHYNTSTPVAGTWPTTLAALEYPGTIPDPLFDASVASVSSGTFSSPGTASSLDPYPLVLEGGSAADALVLEAVANLLGEAATYDSTGNEIEFLVQPPGEEAAHLDLDGDTPTFAHVSDWPCDECREFHTGTVRFQFSGTDTVVVPVTDGVELVAEGPLRGTGAEIAGDITVTAAGTAVTVVDPTPGGVAVLLTAPTDPLNPMSHPAISITNDLVVTGNNCIFDPALTAVPPPECL